MSKVRDLPEKTGQLDDNDLIYVVDTSEGPNGGRKVTVEEFRESSILLPDSVKDAYESNANTNAFTDAEKSKLAGIEAGATADQLAADVPIVTPVPLTATNVQAAIDQLSEMVRDPNIIHVSKFPGPGQFSSVKAAIDSITDASIANPYAVKVGAGVFIEDTITMKPYVLLEGEDDSVSILEVDSPSKHLIVGSADSEVKALELRGSTDPGVSIVYYQGSTSSVSPFSVIDCVFGSGSILMHFEGGAAPTLGRVESCRVKSGAFFSQAVKVSRTGIGYTQVFVGTFIYQRLTAPFPESVITVSDGARLVIDTSLIEVMNSSTDGIVVTNGASIDVIYLAVGGLNRALYVPNIGAAPTINTAKIIIRGCTQDVLVEHPFATGNLSGSADSNKVTIAASDFSVTYNDLTNGGATFSGGLRIGRRQETIADVLDLIESGSTMGLMDGGELAEGGSFTVDVSAGFGYLMDGDFPDHKLIRLTWEDQTINLSASVDVYVYVNTSGILSSSQILPDTHSTILLGRVVTNASAIEFIEQTPMSAHHYSNHLDEMIRDAFGSVYASGSIVSENATPFKLDITAGRYYLSSNKIEPGAGTAIQFLQYYRNGFGGQVRSIIDTVNHSHYDDGTGTLAPMTTGYFCKHALYLSGNGADVTYILVLAQVQYDSLAAAETGLEPLPPSFVRSGMVHVANVIVQEGAANITSIVDTRPTLGFKADALSGSSDHGNLTGLGDDDHTQYLLANGARSLSGNLNLSGNNITNVNLVDGVDVSAHASRHLPNGADPIATGTPVTTLSGAVGNAAGTANSLARSDHTHAVADVTTSISGYMSAADKVKLNGIEAGATADQLASEVPFTPTGNVAATNVQAAIAEVDSEKQALSEKGQPNGYASLDGSGKIPESQLPTKMMEFEGNWDASTNTPTLANSDTGKQGTTYRVSAAGSVDFGAGSISFDIGDWVYNSGTEWQRGDNVDQVVSVFGRQGAVIAQSGDYTGLQVSYTRADGSKKVILAASDDVQSAINDLDDLKLSRSGALAMTGNLDMGASSITNVNLVDGVDVSAHASRHLPDGVDALTTAAPVAIATANAIGTANSFSRSDHVHSHGIQTDGTLHSPVTTSVNGFMIAADKVKLDTLNRAFLQYTNNANQTTTSAVFADILLQTDVSSFPNSLLTKTSNTNFRTDFNGYVKVTFNVVAYPDANDRGIEFIVRKNGVDQNPSRVRTTGVATLVRSTSATSSIILSCAVNDIFTVAFRSLEGAVVTIESGFATARVELYRT